MLHDLANQALGVDHDRGLPPLVLDCLHALVFFQIGSTVDRNQVRFFLLEKHFAPRARALVFRLLFDVHQVDEVELPHLLLQPLICQRSSVNDVQHLEVLQVVHLEGDKLILIVAVFLDYNLFVQLLTYRLMFQLLN